MKSTTQLLKILKNTKDYASIDAEIEDVQLVDFLNQLLEKYHTTISKISKRTNLDRTYTYQIFEGIRNPSQDKIILIALGMKASLEDTNRLLMLSNNGSLYPKVKRDSIIIYGITHNLNLFEINELLEEYNLQILK